MKTSNATTSPKRGVTLIEMLVVVTIIALFAALVARDCSVEATPPRSRRRGRRSRLHNQLGMYKLDTGNFPTTEQGLQALRVKPEDVEQWQGPYSNQDIPIDPWGHPFVYKFPGEHGDEPDIIPTAPTASRAATGTTRTLSAGRNRANQAGVTLIEMLVVVSLIALMVGISFPSILGGNGFAAPALRGGRSRGHV